MLKQKVSFHELSTFMRFEISYMKMGSFIKLLAPVLFVSAVAIPLSDIRTPPAFSQIYSVKGVLYLPYAEIEEPFHAWYDGPSKKSRIDYYGATVKTYQLGSVDYGKSLKIVPFTTEEVTNVITCLQNNGTMDNPVEPQLILPSLDGFEFAGKETIRGIDSEKWNLTELIGQKKNKYTMWISYKPNLNGDYGNIAVPVRYEMRGYNTLLGSHYDRYYLEYDSFSVDEISTDIFEVPEGLTCTSFPGPGKQHRTTFNPMAEFIRPELNDHVDSGFHEFLNKHGKQYTDEKEHTQRKEVFRQNTRFIQSVNRQNRGYNLAVNHLSDKTEAELKALRGKQYTGVYNGGQPFPYEDADSKHVPQQWDWRLYGAVTPVKDQAVCGSCWSFGTVGAVEGAYFLKNGRKLVHLSQQALVDCSWGFGNNGCDGGEDFRSYQWMLKHGGISTDEDYGSYLGQDGFCHAEKVPKVAAISGWVNVTTNDKKALKLAIFEKGPISVAIDASQRTFSFYSNGVYYEPKCGNKDEDLDHSVLAVGYGTIDGEDYWLIRNSWSTYWGNDGYILMSAKNNNCGVMTSPTYVIMA
ncbi:digestive cysteine proteinase 1 [Leptinotarsa decemlineata]|uniref:digestive cysteine proteinase 1 n=1 Tax=Leptinotarsa decemlineata TaxID=7539 RepID=UPI003D30435A